MAKTRELGRAADLIRTLPPEEQQGFRKDFLVELAPYRKDAGGYDIPTTVLNATAS